MLHNVLLYNVFRTSSAPSVQFSSVSLLSLKIHKFNFDYMILYAADFIKYVWLLNNLLENVNFSSTPSTITSLQMYLYFNFRMFAPDIRSYNGS